MAFLRLADYKKQIQTDNLNVVIENDNSIRVEGELAALEEVQSYLRHRFDVALIFADLIVWDNTTDYNTGDSVAHPDAEGTIYVAIDDPGVNEDPPTYPGKWKAQDPRNQKLLQVLIDITLYHLHSRINPRNIPELRLTRRDEAIQWLKMINEGKITPNLPLVDAAADTGNKIRWAARPKFDNTY